MDQGRRFNRNLSNESKKSPHSLQKKLVETRRPVVTKKQEQVPDLTDFINDMFFGTVNNEKKVYNLKGEEQMEGEDEEEEEDGDFDSSTRSINSKLTHEWLQEAKRMVASSPTRRNESPVRLRGSPRFAGGAGPQLSTSNVDRRDPLSRSARRHRPVEGFTGDIITKSAQHSRNNSQTLESPPPTTDSSPVAAVHKWFANILNPIAAPPSPDPSSPPPTLPLPPRISTSRRSRFENQTTSPPPALPSSATTTPIFPPATNDPNALFPPRLSTHRKSRFQNDPNSPLQQPQLIPTKRVFKPTGNDPNSPFRDTLFLSPPKHLNESAHRRSISSSTCSLQQDHILSPPRNLVESASRRSISSSTCSTEKIRHRLDFINGESKEHESGEPNHLNGFLKQQKVKIRKLLNGELQGKAKIVLSGPSNSTSSMVGAICYAWWLEKKMRKNNEGYGSEVVVPVLNIKRGKMWKQRQAAWLFHNAGVDASALLFADEVDLETLMMNKQLTMLVVGQDVLKNNGEVGSKCTILADNYCEDAYDQLQIPVIKELLLAGILLDTQNLNSSAKMVMTRDAEAVQLLSVGSVPNYRNSLYDQLTQDKRDSIFFEALRQNYGKPPNESNLEGRKPVEGRVSERKPYSEAARSESDKGPTQAKNAKFDNMPPMPAKGKPSPKQTPSPVPVPVPVPAPAPAPAPAPPAKNKNLFAKWFGFGK